MKKIIFFFFFFIFLIPFISSYVDIDNTVTPENTKWINIQSESEYHQEFVSYYDGLNSISGIQIINNGSTPCNITFNLTDKTNNRTVYLENIGNANNNYSFNFDDYESKGHLFRIIFKENSKSKYVFNMSDYSYTKNKINTSCYILKSTIKNEEIRGIGRNIVFKTETSEKNQLYKLTHAENDLRKFGRGVFGTKEQLKGSIPFYIFLIFLSIITYLLLHKNKKINHFFFTFFIILCVISIILKSIYNPLLILGTIILFIFMFKHNKKLFYKIPFSDFNTLINQIRKIKLIYWIGLTICCIIFLFFTINHLGQFETVDEPKWIYDNGRVDQLYQGITEFKPWKTVINDKPGIIPAYLSGLFVSHKNISDYNYNTVENYFFGARLPIVIFNTIMLIIIFILISLLHKPSSALLTAFLISTHTLIIGMSQIVITDGVLWSVSFIAILSYFLWLKSNNIIFIYLTGVFLGLASLTKYFGNIIYYFLFIWAIIHYTEKYKNNKLKEKLNNEFKNIIKIWVIAFITIFILYPATWIYPPLILQQSVMHALVMPLLGIFLILLSHHFYNILNSYIKHKNLILKFSILSFLLLFIISLINIATNYKIIKIFNLLEYNIIQKVLYGFHAFLLTENILVIILFFITLFHIYYHKNCVKNNLLYFLITFFILAPIVGGILDRRYSIILVPIILFLVSDFATTIKIKYIKPIVFMIIVLCSLLFTINAMPFYYSQTNILNWNNKVVFETWGMGGYEVAQKLNNLNNIKNISIWTDIAGVNIFFNGKSYRRYDKNPFLNKSDIDYLVLTVSGNRVFDIELLNYNNGKINYYSNISGQTPLLKHYHYTPIITKELNSNPNNYIKVVKME